MNPRARLVVCAVLFSTGGAAIKLVGFGGWQVAACRALVAGTTLLVLIPEARRGWSWRTLLVGVAYGGTTLQYVLSNTYTTAANAVFIQSTYPLFVVFLAPWLLGERVGRRDVWQLVAMAAGLVLFFAGTQRRFATAPDPFTGNLLAAGSALFWGLTVIGYRWLVQNDRTQGGPIAAAAVAGNLVAVLVALPLAWPLEAGRPADWAAIAYLGVFQLGFAYYFLTRAIPEVPALEASLFLLVEPVINPVWAWLLHGEVPGSAAVAGGTIILAATVARSWWDARGRARMPTEAA